MTKCQATHFIFADKVGPYFISIISHSPEVYEPICRLAAFGGE